MPEERKIAAPPVNVETQPFWDAAGDGRFVLPRCSQCGKTHWFPRAVCPFCFGVVDQWFEAAGRGTIYTLSVMVRAEIPYAIAYVTLDEGPTMLTNIVDCELDTLAIGQRVKLVFKPSEGGPPVPMFTPI